MKKPSVLQGLIALQAVCMIVLTIVVLLKVLPPQPGKPSSSQQPNGLLYDAWQNEPAAHVGTKLISRGEWQDELARQHGQEVLYNMMVSRAIELEAEAYGLTVQAQELDEELVRMMAGYEDETTYYRTMKEQLGLSKEDLIRDAEQRLLLEKIAVRSIPITDTEVSNYIAWHPELFESRIRLRISWIVLSTYELAELVLQELVDGIPFAVLAQQYSLDEFTAENGGDLGLVELDDPFLEASVLTAAADLEVGDASGPIQVEDGYAVIQLNERHSSKRMDERRKLEMARRLAALEKAKPMQEIERDLLIKYETKIFP